MRTFRVSKVTALVLFAACGLAAHAFPLRQATTPKTAAKPSTSTRVSAKNRSARKRKPRERAQRAPTQARISEIQSALAAQGAYKGQPNGKWDSATAQGMKDFQSAHGLTPTGKLDALSLQKLSLGSEIAGRAAPLPQPQTQGAPPSGQQQQSP